MTTSDFAFSGLARSDLETALRSAGLLAEQTIPNFRDGVHHGVLVYILPVDDGVTVDWVGSVEAVPAQYGEATGEVPAPEITPAVMHPGYRANLRLTGPLAAERAALVYAHPWPAGVQLLAPADIPAGQLRWSGGSHPYTPPAPDAPPPATPEPTLAQRKTALRARLAERRWQVETGGIVVAGIPIATDLVAQTKIDGALSLASLTGEGASWSTPWKGADGAFRIVTQSDLIGIALAVGRHVQACYTREAALATEIDAAGADDVVSLAAQVEAFELPLAT